MSAITPHTELRLLKLPLELDDKNQINFANKTAQYNYFNSLQKLIVDNITYQRKDNVIRYPAHIDTIIQYNYCMYQNENYTDKWFYAFITNMEYINDNMTAITIETDSWQTWCFDLIYNKSFVEREHVNDDGIGKHTIPEGLETGEYVVNSLNKNTLLNTKKVIIATTVDPVIQGGQLIGGNVSGGIYNGIGTGYRYYYFDNLIESSSTTDTVTQVLKAFDVAGYSDAIQSVFIAPLYSYEQKNTTITNNGEVKQTYTSKVLPWDYLSNDTQPTRPTNFQGYTPKNKKLFTKEYCYLLMSNGNGTDVVYNYEDFGNSGPYFEFAMDICPGMSIICYPCDYKGIPKNFVESIPAGKYPVCGWSSDTYINWLTQQSINNTLGFASDTMNVVSGIANIKSGTYQLTSGIMGIASRLGKIYEHSFAPVHSKGNTNCGDVMSSTNLTTFSAYGMTIKKEYAQIIDQYFSIFGYKVNTVKTPQITSRRYWNYIKTIDVSIHGYIPQEDLNKIKDLFNNGITFWHDTTKYLDYSQSNTIV